MFLNKKNTKLNVFNINISSDAKYEILGNIYYFFKKFDSAIDRYNMIKVKKLKIFLKISRCYFFLKKYTEAYNLIVKYTNQYFFRSNHYIYDDMCILNLKMKNLPYAYEIYDKYIISRTIYSKIKLPQWNLSETCSSLLIYGDQGLGDQIHFFKYIFTLMNKFKNIKIYLLLSKNINNIFIKHENICFLDHFNPQMLIEKKIYLSYLVKLQKEFINKYPIYIKNDQGNDLYWENVIKNNFKHNFTIVLCINSETKNFIKKNLLIQKFYTLFNLNCNFIILDYKLNYNKDYSLVIKENVHIFHIDYTEPFHDTISIIKNSDLVITIDSVYTHISCNLHKKTILLLNTKYYDWRWDTDINNYTLEIIEIDYLHYNFDNLKEFILKNFPCHNLLFNNINNYSLSLARQYFNEKKYQDSLNIYQYIGYLNLNIDSDLPNIANCHLNTNDYYLAYNIYKKLIYYRYNETNIFNLGNLMIKLKIYNQAIDIFKMVKLTDTNTNILQSIAYCYFLTNNHRQAINYCNKLSPSDSSFHLSKFTLSNIYLKNECLITGFQLYENRLLCNHLKNTFFKLDNIPLWNNENCSKLLIIHEQGIGDKVQFYRYVLEISDRYPSIKLLVLYPSNIQHIFIPNKNIKFIENLKYFKTKNNKKYFKIKTKKGLQLDYVDFQIHLMSIPLKLKIKKITPYISKCYINVNQNKYNYWKHKFNEISLPKVGIFNKGNNITYIKKYIPIHFFTILTDLPIYYIYLDKKKSESLSSLHSFEIDTNQPFIDTIAILKNIDLLISVDSGIVHIAANLGIPTWILTGYQSQTEWRWFNDIDSKWYNNVKIYRLSKNQNWNNLLEIVKIDLVNTFNLPKKNIFNLIKNMTNTDTNYLSDKIITFDKNILNIGIEQLSDKYIGYYLYGCFEESMINYISAINYYKQSHSCNTNHIPTIINLGKCYYLTGDICNSIKYTLKAVCTSVNDELCNHILAESYYLQNNYKKSIEFYKKILNLNPDQKHIQIKLAKIQLKICCFKEGFRNIIVDNSDINFIKNHKNYAKILILCDDINILLLFFRYVALLSKKYKNLHVYLQINSIYRHLFDELSITLISNINNVDYDCMISISSLPYILNVNIINQINFVRTFNKNIQLKNKKQGLIVGVYCPTKILVNLKNILSTEKNIKFIILNNELNEENISIIEELDIMISIDSPFAHFSALKNIETYLLLDTLDKTPWYWFISDKCLWYNNMYILRNKLTDSWNDSTKFLNKMLIKKLINLNLNIR